MMTSSSVSCSLNNIQTSSEQLNIIYENLNMKYVNPLFVLGDIDAFCWIIYK
jgi:hypothetical protein